MTAKKTLVLGIGNLLLTDEAAGVRAVEALEAAWKVPDEVTLLDGGTAGMDLLNPITDCNHLVILDAVATGDPPGTVVSLRGDEVPSFFRSKLSPHQIGLPDILASAELQGAQIDSISLFGVVPFDMEMGLELSPECQAKIPELVALAAQELRNLGYEIEEIA